MSWQDELRRLDEELAAGRLAAEDYRRQRDELLSRAATAAGRQPAAERPPDAPPAVSSSPFPPPFRWQSSNSESTQVIPPIPGEVPPDDAGSSDTTQVVKDAGEESADGAEAGRTQVVPGAPIADSQALAQHGWPAPNVGGVAGHTVPPWQQPGPGSSAPPWAGSDPVGALEPAWLRQGPEVFDTAGRSGAVKLVVVLGLVLVVLFSAGAIYLFGFNGRNQPAAQTTTTAPTTTATPTTTTIPKPAGPFVDIDGRIVLNATMPIDEAIRTNRPAKGEMPTLQTGGTQEVAVFLTDLDDIRRGIWTFRTGSRTEAQALLQAIDARYVSAQYQEIPGAGKDVIARVLPGADPQTPTAYRAHYVRDAMVIRVEAYGTDAATVEQQFRELLGRQLDDYPPR